MKNIENNYKDMNTKDLKKIFINTVVHNDIDLMIYICSLDKGFNIFNDKKQDALKIAVEKNHSEMVEYLLENNSFEEKAQADIKNAKVAASRGNIKILSLVLSSIFKNNNDKKNKYQIKCKLLTYAISKGNFDTTKYLIEDLIKEDKYYKFKSVLFKYGLKFLKNNHFLNYRGKNKKDIEDDKDYKDINYFLRQALLSENLNIVKYILESDNLKNYLNIENQENKFLLHFATEFSSKEIIQYIIENYNNNLFLRNSKDQDVFHIALEKRGEQIVSFFMNNYLIENKEYLIENQEYILVQSILNGDMETFKKVIDKLEKQFDVNMVLKDENYNSLLDLAYQNYNKNAVKYLLSLPNTELSNMALYDGVYNLFHYACEAEDNDMVTHLLIERKFPINNELIDWLKGNNESEKIYEDILKMIKDIELHAYLNEKLINDNEISKMKVKKI